MESEHNREKVIELEIYTDGSAKSVGRFLSFGGWGYIVVRDGKEVCRERGGALDTTNQRMELEAIRQALFYAAANRRKNERVVIYSDSAYAVNCYLQEWYVNWQENGWFNSQHKPVANRDIWQDIIPFFENFWYDFRKVEGHAGVLWNEECDKLAQAEAQKLKNNWRGQDGR